MLNAENSVFYLIRTVQFLSVSAGCLVASHLLLLNCCILSDAKIKQTKKPDNVTLYNNLWLRVGRAALRKDVGR